MLRSRSEPEVPGHPAIRPSGATGIAWPHWQLICPICGNDYVYPDEGESEWVVTDGYSSPLGNRGSWIPIPMRCEVAEHSWRLVIGFHKGMTFMDACPPDHTTGSGERG